MKNQKLQNINSMEDIEAEMQRLEEDMTKQHLVNKKIKRNRIIFLFVLFILIAFSVIYYKVSLTSHYDAEIEKYRLSAEQQNSEYQKTLEELNK